MKPMNEMNVSFLSKSSNESFGRAAVASLGIIAKRPEELGKAMMYPALVETYAVLSLLISFLMWLGIAV